MFWLGLAWKPRLWLGLGGLWLPSPQAKAKAVGEGLAWLGFGSSRGLNHIFLSVEIMLQKAEN